MDDIVGWLNVRLACMWSVMVLEGHRLQAGISYYTLWAMMLPR